MQQKSSQSELEQSWKQGYAFVFTPLAFLENKFNIIPEESVLFLYDVTPIILLADILCRRSPNSVALYTLTSVCIFSILFPIHFLRC